MSNLRTDILNVLDIVYIAAIDLILHRFDLGCACYSRFDNLACVSKSWPKVSGVSGRVS